MFPASSKTIRALLGGCALLACSGPNDHFAPAGVAQTRSAPATTYAGGAPERASSASGGRDVSGQDAGGEGVLDVFVGTALPSFLGPVQAVVTDAAGRVVGGAVGEVAQPADVPDDRLSLPLPAGDDYTLSLSAMTVEEHPTACAASAGPFKLAAGATAQVQILAWTCGDAIGYLPATLSNDCYWVADWAFIGRSRAAVGEPIDVSASGHDAHGNLAQFEWSTALPERGHFVDPRARATSFRCRAASGELPLSVSITAGTCQQTLTRTVTCL